jgi:hypothetical protein
VNAGAGPSGQAINGNVGVAGTGKLGLSGGGGVVLINGNVDFAGTVTPSSLSGGSSYVSGTISGGQAIVQTAMNYLNTLSATLGGEAGTSISLNSGTVINASAGSIDGSGNSVFKVTSMNLPNGTVTINGDGVHSVVINFAVVANFHAEHVVLTGGLTSDQVLWNFYGGNNATLDGGPTMNLVSGGGSPSHPDNILYGVFLDPYGDISITDTILYGRAFGGDSHNEQIVSGAYINAPPNNNPPPPAVPEPTTFIAGTLLLLPFGASTLRILRRKATA